MSRHEEIGRGRIILQLMVLASILACQSEAGPADVTPRVSVTPNVQISLSNADVAHAEVSIATDPQDANRLIACAMVVQPHVNQSWHISERTVTYVSSDGGLTWRPTLQINAPADYPAIPPTVRTPYVGDPSCVLGRGGVAYSSTHHPEGLVSVSRSVDGGETWGPVQTVPNVGDRAWLTVDNSQSRFRGRVYLAGGDGFAYSETGEDYLAGGSRHIKTVDEDPRSYSDQSDAAVLSDGTYIDLVWQPVNQAMDRLFFMNYLAIASSDGVSFDQPILVSTSLICPGEVVAGTARIAADVGSTSPFRDRLYVAWTHYDRDRCSIFLAHSSDRGRSWSQPTQINDDLPSPAGGPHDFMPAVAVNKEGIVGVMWYDRRESDDQRGYAVHFAYSLDGGESFGPSIKVSEQPSRWTPRERFQLLNSTSVYSPRQHRMGLTTFSFTGGDYAGMAADADGRFRPIWVDNRTGVLQVWTAAITVSGTVALNGDPLLSKYRDVSDSVRVDIVNIIYDGRRNSVAADAYLTNTSRESIRGPIKLRALLVSSDLGQVRAANADNGVEGNGALWDFHAQLDDGVLRPGVQTARPKRLEFELANVIPFPPVAIPIRGWYPTYVQLVTKVLAGQSIAH